MHYPDRPDSATASRDADAISPSLSSRRLHAVALVIVVAVLAASAGIKAALDARPLDVQLSAAMHKAGDTLQALHGHLARGLQVSLLAVADGRDVAPAAVALAVNTKRDQPLRVKAAADPASPRPGR